MSGEGGVVTLGTSDDARDDHDDGTHLDSSHGAGGDDGEAVHEDGEQQEADLNTRIGDDKIEDCDTHHVESIALSHAHEEGVAALGVELCAASLHLCIAADP